MMNPSCDEEEIIRNVLKGQKEQFSVLVQRYSSGCQYYFWTKCGQNTETARDLTQEAFLRAFRSLSTFKPGTSFPRWLRTICHHLGVDFYKTSSRQESLKPSTIQTHAGHEQDVIRRQTLSGALELLSERQREVVTLKYLWSCTLDEICAIMEIPLGTAKADLVQGRKRLLEILEKAEDL